MRGLSTPQLMMIKRLLTSHLIKEVFERCPALHFALLVLVSTACVLTPHLIPVLLLPILLLVIRRPLFSLSIIALTASATLYRCPTYTLPKDGITGTAYFHIDKVTKQTRPFMRGYIYSGTMVAFHPKDGGKPLYSMPARIYVSSRKDRPLSNYTYILKNCKCLPSYNGCLLKQKQLDQWIPHKKTLSLSETRLELQKSAKTTLKTHSLFKRTNALFGTLLTGTTQNEMLSYRFNRLGLSHLLAVSGFHLGGIALLLGLILRPFLTSKYIAFFSLAMLISLSLYFGAAPSISRASIVIIFFSLSILLGKPANPLNLLGIAMLFSLLFDPYYITNLGWMLSYGATLAILLLYQPVKDKLYKLFPKRSKSEVRLLPRGQKYALFASRFFLSSLSLNIAVLLPLLPMLLTYFHSFPLLSLPYNLILTPLFAISFLTFFGTLFLYPIFPPLAIFIHHVNEHFTLFLLDIVRHAPAKLDYRLEIHSVSPHLLLLLLTAIYTYGLVQYSKRKNLLLQ